MQELCLNTTTATGCALGVKHPFSGKLVGQRWIIASSSKRFLDRITLSCQGAHQHHEIMNSYHTLGIPFPDTLARRVCRILVETTSGEEVFAFIAAASAGTGNDGQKENGVQETTEPATKKQRNHPESHHTEAEVSKKDLEQLTRHLQSIHSSCGHCSNETLVRALRRKGAKPLILRLARDFVCPSCQEIQKSTSAPSRKPGSHSSQVAKHSD